MDIFLQLIVSGTALGGIYALIALGFVLIYKATGILNFATGEFMMIGAYICYTLLVVLDMPVVPAFILVMLAASVLGLLVERLILRHMLGRPAISVVMVTLGLSFILIGLAEMIWTSDFRSLPPIFPRRPLILGDIVIRSNMFYGFLIALAAVIAFALLFKYTKVGLAMRATAADQAAAFSMGVNVNSLSCAKF